CAGGVTGLDYW
nr:immunoglobulin heavy chain junction region [Macaca mulatta]MOW45965.1 immunoglobulin heavy chain junction region [Macaca mulatta]MOW46466.1 immunoglobulin heavy chain junction region [Macaca mulatta]MOW46986.1 immunoglobulin heavy chain junction region [Macaca mulatta]MOW47042.1 immunoglobulin heavy chain junction region [Macaca mulatta]